MNYRGAFLTCIAASLLMSAQAVAAPVSVNLTSAGLGADLDEIAFGDTPAGPFAVPGIPGLSITVIQVIDGNAASDNEDLNATTTSLGINDSLTGDDTDAFDSDRGESATFQFNQDVTIHFIDFANFASGEEFSFAGLVIGNDDLTNGTSDTIDLDTEPGFSPIAIAANTDFSVFATSGNIGLQAISISAIPEPSSVALLGGIGLLGFVRRRRSI